MPPSAHWGKRPRDMANDDEPFTRFSELSPAQKLERRAEERAAKKERDRTLSYFKSVQRALEEQSGGGGDVGALASIVDGFFSELLKLLRADPSFYILRNGIACRVIELALANAMLLHVKSLLYVFLGHTRALMTSPVASFTLETLLAALSQGLCALGETNPEGLELELMEGGVGMHTGSGVPSTASLLHSMTEEIAEHAEDLLVHEVAGRALRSIVLVLGGRAIRQAPQPLRPVTFPRLLGTLGETIMKALEEGYMREYETTSVSEAWMAAVQAPVTSLVVQSLLRVSDEGSPVDVCVRQRLASLTYKGKPLLHHLLLDPLGCHVFQSFLRVRAPAAVVADGDTFALTDAPINEGGDAKEETPESLMVPGGPTACCWSRAAELVLVELNHVLKPGSDLVAQISYVLQDLALYAPSEVHLRWLWRRVLSPRLEMLCDVPALTPVLLQLVKRCAFEGVALSSLANGPGSSGGRNITTASSAPSSPPSDSAPVEVNHHGTVLPAEVVAMLRKDVAQEVRYGPLSLAFQSTISAAVCGFAKQRTAKGAVQYLLVQASAGEKGQEAARYLLHCHPTASRVLQHSLDKVQRNDLLFLLQSRSGSLFMQQYIRVAALANTSNDATEPLMRLLRCILPSLRTLVEDRYAAFTVETLYETASLSVKESLVTALVPVYQDLRKASSTAPAAASPTETVADEAAEEGGEGKETAYVVAPRFIAYKVMAKCCVEQYVHRKEDWTKLAERQCQVQKLLRRMLLSE